MVVTIRFRFLAAAVLAAGCSSGVTATGSPDAGTAPDVTVVLEDPGDQPLRALATADVDRFRAGDGLFDVPFRDVDGLGPVYIRTSCAACHASAGRGPGLVRKFQIVDDQGQPVATAPELAYGNTARPYVAGGGLTPIVEPAPPAGPRRLITSERVGPSVLGRGYIEAIADAEIERVAAEQATRPDAIHGRINRVTYHSEANPLSALPHARGDANLIGRFGLKARVATLDDFTADAFQGDMGLTSPLRPTEVPNPDMLTDDHKPGIDLTAEHVATVAQYVRTLAIPDRDPKVINGPGRALFDAALCSACHVPSLHTRADFPVAALANLDAPVFSDVLLHDMGDLLADDLLDESAAAREWKTAPLVGLRFQRTFLHDGRAHSIEEAIRLHAGPGSQANDSVSRFDGLTPDDRQHLLEFVQAL